MDNKLRLSIWKNSFIIREKNIQLRDFMTNQTGGVDRKLKIKYNDNKYIFDELLDENHYILYSIEELSCVTVIIYKKDNVAEIHGIANYKSCLKEINTNVGSTLLKITIKMLQKYKEKFDIKKILLTDNSVKKCNDKNIKLAVMLTLLTGDTWYGKYGFRPYDDTLTKYYENNKKIMNTITLKDIDLLKYLKMTTLDEKVIEKSKIYIEKHQTTLLKDYLTKFIKEYDKTCEYFYQPLCGDNVQRTCDFYFTLFIDLGLYDFNRQIFELVI
jgi:hypothetical protein